MSFLHPLHDWLETLPIHYIVMYLIAINALTYGIYAYDKKAAENGKWRVQESILHLVMFVGGTVAAYVAQQKLRHKTKKASFRRTFFLFFILQLTCLGLMMAA